MQSFVNSIDEFLRFNSYEVLEDQGSVSRKNAKQKAIS